MKLDHETPPLLQGLSGEARKRLLERAVAHDVGVGTVLFRQGDLPTFQHVALAGSIHLFGRSSDGREVLVEVVEPPDLVLPAAVLTASPYLCEARALAPARLLLIEAAAFRAAVAAETALAQAAIASLAGQFRRMVRQIKSLKLRTAPQRVGCYILELSSRNQSSTVTLPYEKSLIASELGMTRESFSRALAMLQQNGLAARGETLVIVDRERLEAVARPDPLIDGPEAATGKDA